MPRKYGSWPLNVCQYGAETTNGTAAPATGIWRGPFGHFEDDIKTEEIEEDIGTFAVTNQEFVVWGGVTVPAPSGALNLLQFPVLLKASVMAVTPTGTGPYVRQYDAAFGDTDPDIQPYTLRVGNKRTTADVWMMPFSFVKEWEISGKAEELWKLSHSWTAPRRVPGTFTPDVMLRGFDPVLFAKTLLYIDNSGGTIGTTQKLGVLMAASIKWKTGIEWVPVGDGNTYSIGYKLGRPDVTFSLTYELEQDGANSVVADERARHDSRSFGLFRLRLPGSGVNVMDIDFAGRYSKIGPYTKEGEMNTTVTFEGRALYSPADAKFFGIKHTSSLVSVQ